MDRVSGYIHAHTLYGAVRPFGCNVMFSSYTPTEGPRLYMVDPSGVSWVRLRIWNVGHCLCCISVYT